jgi:hypothetical protein
MQSEFLAKIFGDKEDPRRRLEDIFGGVAPSAGPPPAARAWATTVLARAGIDPVSNDLAAITCLRRAQPRLTLRAATYLAKDAAVR